MLLHGQLADAIAAAWATFSQRGISPRSLKRLLAAAANLYIRVITVLNSANSLTDTERKVPVTEKKTATTKCNFVNLGHREGPAAGNIWKKMFNDITPAGGRVPFFAWSKVHNGKSFTSGEE
jgi:hypothetical protein